MPRRPWFRLIAFALFPPRFKSIVGNLADLDVPQLSIVFVDVALDNECIDPNGGCSRSLVKLMHKQITRVLTRERSECVSALGATFSLRVSDSPVSPRMRPPFRRIGSRLVTETQAIAGKPGAFSSKSLSPRRRGWTPVCVAKMRPDKEIEPRSDSIGTEKALVRQQWCISA